MFYCPGPSGNSISSAEQWESLGEGSFQVGLLSPTLLVLHLSWQGMVVFMEGRHQFLPVRDVA